MVAVPTGTAGASRYFLDLDARGGETNDEKTRGGPRMPAVLVQGGLPLLTPMYIYIYTNPYWNDSRIASLFL